MSADNGAAMRAAFEAEAARCNFDLAPDPWTRLQYADIRTQIRWEAYRSGFQEATRRARVGRCPHDDSPHNHAPFGYVISEYGDSMPATTGPDLAATAPEETQPQENQP